VLLPKKVGVRICECYLPIHLPPGQVQQVARGSKITGSSWIGLALVVAAATALALAQSLARL